MLYFLVPCAYTSISGINLLENKRKRIVVLLAGILTGMLITVLAAVGYVCHKENTNDTHMDESDKR